jgi:hypothetical protein
VCNLKEFSDFVIYINGYVITLGNMNNTNIKTVATEFRMPVEKFVELYRQKRLPGQLPSRTFYEQQDSEIDLGVKLDAIKKSPAWQVTRRGRVALMRDQWSAVSAGFPCRHPRSGHNKRRSMNSGTDIRPLSGIHRCSDAFGAPFFIGESGS